MTIEVTAADEVMLDAWWKMAPKKSEIKEIAIPPGAMVVVRNCKACNKRSEIAVHWAGMLCGVCRANLDKTEERIKKIQASLEAQLDKAMATWAMRQADLDDETASRWYRLCGDRQTATAALTRAQTEKYYQWTAEEIAENVTKKRATFDEVMGKIERTKGKGGTLAQLLKEESEHQAELKRINEARASAEIALQEVFAARDDEVPF